MVQILKFQPYRVNGKKVLPELKGKNACETIPSTKMRRAVAQTHSRTAEYSLKKQVASRI
jgi:hypothetical protein